MIYCKRGVTNILKVDGINNSGRVCFVIFLFRRPQLIPGSIWCVVYENLGVTLGRFLLLHRANVVAGDKTALNQPDRF